MKYLTFAAGVFCATGLAAQTPELTVYTYDSFISEWGPGPQIEKAFEAECGCDLKFVGAGDGAFGVHGQLVRRDKGHIGDAQEPQHKAQVATGEIGGGIDAGAA